jgi:protein TonB
MRLKNVLTPRRPVVVRPPGRGFDVTVMTTGKSGAAGCSIVNSPFSAADNETVCTAWVEAGRPGLLGRKSPPAAAQRKPLAPRTPASTPPRTPARGGLAQISVSLGKNSWEIAVVERPIWRNMDIVYPGLPTSTLTPIMSFEGSVKSSIDSLDYPRLALIEGLEGKVLALVGFGREGTPLSCRPLQSSGTAFLDNATCEVIMRRLRYDFASEIPQFSGKRYYVANVRWVMPTDQDD